MVMAMEILTKEKSENPKELEKQHTCVLKSGHVAPWLDSEWEGGRELQAWSEADSVWDSEVSNRDPAG